MNKQFPFPPEMETEESVDRSAQLRDYIAFVWRHWVFVVSMTALALLFGSLWLARAVPLYTATAQVMLDPLSDRAPVQNPTSPNVFFLDPAMIENQISLIKSDALLRRVVEKNRLYSVPTTAAAKEEAGGFGSLLAGFFGSPEPVQMAAPLDPKAAEESAILAAVEGLRGSLAVQRAGLGYILAISITDANPERASKLANAVAES